MADDDSYLDQAEGKDITSILLMVIGAPLLALGDGASQAIASILSIYSEAAGALSDGISSFIEAFTADPANAMSDVVEFGVESLQEGWYANLGPFSIPIFAGILFLTAWGFLEFLDRRGSDIPFTGTDIPLILGNDSDGEED